MPSPPPRDPNWRHKSHQVAARKASRQLAKQAAADEAQELLLAPRELAFADWFARTNDWLVSAQKVGLKPADGRKLMAREKVLLAIEQKRSVPNRNIVNDVYVRARLSQIVEADPAELSRIVRVPCRSCHGFDHRPQMRPEEYRVAIRQHRYAEQEKARRNSHYEMREFDDLGGVGYTTLRPIYAVRNGYDHDCPECDGLGEAQIYIADTDELSPAARLLFKGVRQTKDGVEILQYDKVQALQMLARHLGMFNDRRPIEELDPEKLSDESLRKVITVVRERLALLEDRPGAAPAILERTGGGEQGASDGVS